MKRQRRPGVKTSSLLYTHEGKVGDESEYQATVFENSNLINGRAIVLEGCKLNRCRIIQAPSLRLSQCTLETVDAANAIMDESGWNNVLTHESRWTGARLNFTHMVDVTFEQCQMKHIQLQECSFKNVRFESCDLSGAYFNGSKLQGTVFAGSNLTGIDFSGADIARCDLRRANIENMRIAPEQLQGVIVTQDQALYLARLLGLDVRE